MPGSVADVLRATDVAPRGACPTVRRPLAAADGLLVRVRLPAGALTVEQARLVARAARRRGNGVVELTSRANLQVRGVRPEALDALADDLAAAGLAARHPDDEPLADVLVPAATGLDPTEVADARPLAARLRARLTAGALAGRPLHPKACVAIDTGGSLAPAAAAGVADVTLVATRRPDGTHAFALHLPDVAPGHPPTLATPQATDALLTLADVVPTDPPVLAAPEATDATVARSTLTGVDLADPPAHATPQATDTTAHAHPTGPPAHATPEATDATVARSTLTGVDLADPPTLTARQAIDATVDLLAPAGQRLTDPPVLTAPEAIDATVDLLTLAGQHPAGPCRVRDLVGAAGRAVALARVGITAPSAAPSDPGPGRLAPDLAEAETGGHGPAGSLLGVVSWPRAAPVAVGALPPLGRLAADRLDALADALERHGATELRVTTGRRVLVPLATAAGAPDRAEALAAELAAVGFVVDPRDPAAGVVACAGRPGCGSAHADTQADGAQVVAALRRAGGPPRTVHVSGCAKRCASRRPHDITLIAEPTGYAVALPAPAPPATVPDPAGHPAAPTAPDEPGPDGAGSGERLAGRGLGLAQALAVAGVAPHPAPAAGTPGAPTPPEAP